MREPPKSIMDAIEAFVFFTTLSSSVRHFVVTIVPAGNVGPFTLAEVCIGHDEPLASEWCEECLAPHGQLLPIDAGFTIHNPPLPASDKVFINPADGWEIEPGCN